LRTGAGFCEIRPFISRTQLVHDGAARIRGGGILGLVTTCAITTVQIVSASVPIRNKRGCFETIARAGCTSAASAPPRRRVQTFSAPADEQSQGQPLGAAVTSTVPNTTESNAPASASAKAEQRAGKYLSFRLGKEDFAIQVLKVREIVGIQDITSVPQMPGYVKGVINLRGKVIPVVDLRLKFGLEEREYTQRTCIIVVQTQHSGVAVQTGIIVDEVSEVLNLAANEIEDTPDFGEDVATPYLLGMAKVKGNVKMLLDIDQVLANSESMSLSGLVS
jgi:purine-binding chemotaxis protein CheW